MRAFCLPLLALILATSGCALCPPGYLEDYAAVGGKWQRSDPACGRVGSIFSDPNSTYHESDGGETVYDTTVDNAVVTPESYYGDETYYEDAISDYGDDVIILGEEF